VTTGTLDEMHCEVFPHPAYSPNLASSDFYLFGPLKKALGGKRFIADDKIKLSVQRWLDEQPQTFCFEMGMMKLPESWRLCIEVQGEYVEKQVSTLKNKFNKFL
jgi:histone-lysine N-methyltransferase SETMAR